MTDLTFFILYKNVTALRDSPQAKWAFYFSGDPVPTFASSQLPVTLIPAAPTEKTSRNFGRNLQSEQRAWSPL